MDRSTSLVLGIAFITSVFAPHSHCGVDLEEAIPITKSPENTPIETYESFCVSKNGRFVAFTSNQALLPGVNAGQFQVYRLDRKTKELLLISRAPDGTPATGLCWYPQISDDGSKVVFASYASNLDVSGNGHSQIVYVDVKKKALRTVSQTWSGVIANADCYFPVISGNGKFIAFSTTASSLLGGIGSVSHIMLYDVEKDYLSAKSFNNAGQWGDGASTDPRLSYDGRYLIYETSATNLPNAGGTNDYKIVMFDRKTGSSWLMSCAQDGTPANDYCSNGVLSADARYVAFLSYATNLTAEQLPPGERRVIVADRKTGVRKSYSVSIAGSVDGLGMSGNGKRLVITTSELYPGTTLYAFRAMVIDHVQLKFWTLDLLDPKHWNGADSINDIEISGNGKKLFFSSPSEKLPGSAFLQDNLYMVPITND